VTGTARRRPTFAASIGFAEEELQELQATEPENLAAYQMSRAMQTVRFEHKCADAEPHQVQAYAELASEDKRARALVLVYVRRDPARQSDIFIGARLVAMRFEAGSASVNWSVSLEAHTGAGSHVGAGQSHYICCPARGEGRRRPFRTDRSGVLEWLDHPEPFDEMGSRYPHNWSPRMETTAATLGLTDERRSVALDLVLTETDAANAVRLRGPTILIPDRIWYARPSKTKNPELLASLNPFVRGGLWRTLARAARSRECIRERRRVKRDFAAR